MLLALLVAQLCLSVTLGKITSMSTRRKRGGAKGRGAAANRAVTDDEPAFQDALQAAEDVPASPSVAGIVKAAGAVTKAIRSSARGFLGVSDDAEERDTLQEVPEGEENAGEGGADASAAAAAAGLEPHTTPGRLEAAPTELQDQAEAAFLQEHGGAGAAA